MAVGAVVVVVLGVTGCGSEDDEDTTADACTALDSSNEETKAGGSIEAAGRYLSEAVGLAVVSDDDQLRGAALGLRDSDDSTADFAIALTDMAERCDELGY